MNSAFNFGVMHNGMVCDCGLHKGVGDLHAGNRAARYARMRDRTPSMLTEQNIQYLESWEQHHGAVVYEMQQSTYKAEKGDNAIGYPIAGHEYLIHVARITSWSAQPLRHFAEADRFDEVY